jgi:hypothetical protein
MSHVVIAASVYWKEELFRSGHYLVGRLRAKQWSERSFSRLEKTIMTAAYAIRKLAEAGKVPPDYLDHLVPIRRYQARNPHVDIINWHDVEANYDLNTPRTGKVRLSHLLNQLIHSFVYMPVIDGSRFRSILFNSDRTKSTVLYEIQAKDLIDIILSFSSGSIVSARYELVANEFKLVEATYKHADLFKRRA